jgi:hypothetical protein
VSAFRIQLGYAPEQLPQPVEADLASFLARHRTRLVDLCGMGPYHRHLPDGLAADALRRASGLELVLDFLQGAELVTRGMQEQQIEVLRGL